MFGAKKNDDSEFDEFKGVDSGYPVMVYGLIVAFVGGLFLAAGAPLLGVPFVVLGGVWSSVGIISAGVSHGMRRHAWEQRLINALVEDRDARSE